MNETRSWRRGFAAGFAALALSIAGQAVTRDADVRDARSSCSIARSRTADRLASRFTPEFDAHSLAQRVARAVIGVVLQTCS